MGWLVGWGSPGRGGELSSPGPQEMQRVSPCGRRPAGFDFPASRPGRVVLSQELHTKRPGFFGGGGWSLSGLADLCGVCVWGGLRMHVGIKVHSVNEHKCAGICVNPHVLLSLGVTGGALRVPCGPGDRA